MRPLAPVLLVALAVTACVVPGSPGVDDGSAVGSGLVPTYAPASTPPGPEPVADPTSATAADTGSVPDDPSDGAADAQGRSGTSPEPAAPDTATGTASAPAGPSPTPTVLRAEVQDAAGDVTFSAEPPPDHADLLGSEVIRDGEGFTVRHTLKNGAPHRTDEEHTMNIATFFDVDGDGEVDYHVWANLSSSGWGSAYFDGRTGRARYADEDDVDVHVDGDGRVVVRFPHGHLADARSFRWSVGSEWGRYEVIGSDAAARDSAPEDHGSVAFPQ